MGFSLWGHSRSAREKQQRAQVAPTALSATAIEDAFPATKPTRGERIQSMWADPMGRISTRALQLLIIVLMTTGVVIALLNLTLVVLPTLIGLIVACALWPLVRLCRKAMNATLAATTVFVGSLLVLGGIGTALFYSVRAEWPQLVEKGTAGVQELQYLLSHLPFEIPQEQIDNAFTSIKDFFLSAQFGAGALNGLSAAGNFVTGLALFLVILFFFLKDGDKMWEFFLSWLPRNVRGRWHRSGLKTVSVFGGYMRGTATVAAVDAIGIALALMILQVPLALPLGVLVFVGAFIPMVGATIAGILAVLVALVANGPMVALIVLAAVILVQQLEGNFLQPVVMGNALSLHPLIILVALTGGTVLGGLVGAVISVPLTAVAWAVIKIWSGRDEENVAQRKVEEAQAEIEAEKGRELGTDHESHDRHDSETSDAPEATPISEAK
ncbi:AI-2E family transporter [Neomicrococcus lactis]|uniref:Putative PurR-regulated permease PerM n=1 Tax=Neomicrococcus lactis TaxID=732241 RepID=A0A7W8YDF1_9MICC|nr:putative PurR-regulated permease PerM [Neomicrococcus lactis]